MDSDELVHLGRPSLLQGIGVGSREARVVRSRRPWAMPRVWGAVALGVLAVLIWYWWANIRSTAPPYEWDLGIVWQSLPTLLQGLKYTAVLTVLSIALGGAIGLVVAMLRLSAPWPVRALVTCYVELMRATPMLVQLVWVYYALPLLTGIQLPVIQAVVLALSLSMGAYYGEAFRSGIQAVAKEQVETADILGLSYAQRMRFVVVPQAFRTILPVLMSISISLFKDTSLVSTLGVTDLMYRGLLISTVSYRPLEVLTTVALIYFVIAFPITLLARRLERHLARHSR